MELKPAYDRPGYEPHEIVIMNAIVEQFSAGDSPSLDGICAQFSIPGYLAVEYRLNAYVEHMRRDSCANNGLPQTLRIVK